MAQILVVDDSSSVREQVSSFLRKSGFSVQIATDGQNALEHLKRDPTIQLIISDVNMPHMDGLSMCEAIRKDLNNATVKILMLTTENDELMKRRGRTAGILGWMVKPFNGNAVLSTIKSLIG